MERFSRLIQLTGKDKFSLLSGKKVLIAGLGAVGGFAAEALARCGIGSITLADFDVIELSNINRHIGALESTLGRPKVEVIGERISGINPKCRVRMVREFLHRENLDQLFPETEHDKAGEKSGDDPAGLYGKPDILIDAIDSLGPKIELLAWAHEAGIETVSSMGAALRKDPSRIRIADLSETDVCPLARNMRKYLRRRGIAEGITCVYSDEAPSRSALRPPDASDEEEMKQFVRGRERNILGSYPVVTAMFGLYAAHAAIEKLVDL